MRARVGLRACVPRRADRTLLPSPPLPASARALLAGRAGAAQQRHLRCIAQVERRCMSSMSISEDRLREFLRAEVSYFAAQEPQSISVSQIVAASTPHLVAQLLTQELPVRYAHRIQQIEGLQGWTTSKDIQEVHRLYFDAFRDLRLMDEPDHSNLGEFTENISLLKKRFQLVIPRLATGMRELQKTQEFSEAFIQGWLDTFLLSRIGTEMLTSQFMAAVKSEQGKGRPSIVNHACDPSAICEMAAKHAQKLCKQHFFLKGDRNVKIVVETQVHESMADSKGRIRFPYVPQYLFYIMVELLKNSARATVENTENTGELEQKPITITVGADHNQVVIRISDVAHGIPFSVADRVWSYMYSTASKGAGNDFVTEGTPLAGYGVGLPLSRLYARYLGGSLQLMSMPGIGTQAYLYLKRVETEAREEVPSSVTSLSDALPHSLSGYELPPIH